MRASNLPPGLFSPPSERPKGPFGRWIEISAANPTPQALRSRGHGTAASGKWGLAPIPAQPTERPRAAKGIGACPRSSAALVKTAAGRVRVHAAHLRARFAPRNTSYLFRNQVRRSSKVLEGDLEEGLGGKSGGYEKRGPSGIRSPQGRPFVWTSAMESPTMNASAPRWISPSGLQRGFVFWLDLRPDSRPPSGVRRAD